MSLLSNEYRAELSALLSRQTTAPTSLSKGFSSPTRLILEAQVPNRQVGGQAVARDLSAAAYTPMRITGGKVLLPFDEQKMERLFGKSPLRLPTITIGDHPDFSGLQYDQTTQHYCASMFVDIVGSTKLIAKGYSLSEIRKIKDTVLTLAIYTANFFGGHVHRLQGDAAFLQFVRANQPANDALLGALTTAAVLCYFVTHDLKEIFQADGEVPLAIRVGIDFGSASQVMWSHYGIPGCSELTTTSLHTDLAAKLQGKAADNEVRIGANVRSTECLPFDCWDPVGNEPLIFPETAYRQYIFNWRNYLNSYDFIRLNGQQLVLDESLNRLTIVCVMKVGATTSAFHQNAVTVKTADSLTFALRSAGAGRSIGQYEIVNWEVRYCPESQPTREVVKTKTEVVGTPTLEWQFAGLKGQYIVQCLLTDYRTSATQVAQFAFFAR